VQLVLQHWLLRSTMRWNEKITRSYRRFLQNWWRQCFFNWPRQSVGCLADWGKESLGTLVCCELNECNDEVAISSAVLLPCWNLT